jgi:metal-responsive CopG/Arc/MetJ family transcriptional regulator
MSQDPATVSITIDLPAALAARIDAFNATMDWDRQTFLRLAARAYLTARERDALEPPPAAGSGPPEGQR